MPTNYPSSIDSFVNPTAEDPPDNPDHAGQHTNINDAMLAVQTALGANPQGEAASVAARIAALEGGGGGLTQYLMTGLVPLDGAFRTRLMDGDATLAWTTVLTETTTSWAISGNWQGSVASGASYHAVCSVGVTAVDPDLNTFNLGIFFQNEDLQDNYTRNLVGMTVHANRFMPPGQYTVYARGGVTSEDAVAQTLEISQTCFTLSVT